MVAYGLNKKVSRGGGGVNILKQPYLNDYAEFESEISYMGFI